MPSRLFSNILTMISIIGVIVSSFFIVINWKYHYGMKQETTITSKLIYPTSASKQMKTLVYQPIGSQNKHKIYIYRTILDPDKIVHTQDNIMTKNKVVISHGKPFLEVRNTRWIYNSGLSTFWFGITGQNKSFLKRINTFHINKDWVVLSVSQANKLKKRMIKNKEPK